MPKCTEVIVTEFPSYSLECLKQTYFGNENDLISTIAMLKETKDANNDDLKELQDLI